MLFVGSLTVIDAMTHGWPMMQGQNRAMVLDGFGGGKRGLKNCGGIWTNQQTEENRCNFFD